MEAQSHTKSSLPIQTKLCALWSTRCRILSPQNSCFLSLEPRSCGRQIRIQIVVHTLSLLQLRQIRANSTQPATSSRSLLTARSRSLPLPKLKTSCILSTTRLVVISCPNSKTVMPTTVLLPTQSASFQRPTVVGLVRMLKTRDSCSGRPGTINMPTPTKSLSQPRGWTVFHQKWAMN